MQEKKHPKFINQVAQASRVRVAYVAPKLRTYGTVNQLTAGSGGSNADMSNMTKMGGSDPALKDNVVRIGTHPLGIGLYFFDYKPAYRESCGYGRQFGVMADEVELVMPKAVVMHPDGYRLVDYAMLGIDLAVHSAIESSGSVTP